MSPAPQAQFQVDPEAFSPQATQHERHRAPVVRTVRHDINKKPFIVIWEVTRACGLVCKHCRADAQHQPHPFQLTTAEGKTLLETLASYSKPKPLVVLTGGDPFERDDLEELVRYGTELGLNMSLSPSVTPKLTPERIQSLREAGGKAMSRCLWTARPPKRMTSSVGSPAHLRRLLRWRRISMRPDTGCKSTPR